MCSPQYIYRERGIVTAEGRSIKNKQEILDLLWAVWLSRKIAVIHFWDTRKEKTPSQGETTGPSDLYHWSWSNPHCQNLQLMLTKSSEELHMSKCLQRKRWLKTPDEWILPPSDFTTQLVQQIHQSTHLGEKKIQELLRRPHLKAFDFKSKTTEAISPCPKWQPMNAKNGVTRTGHQERGTWPGANWEIDFMEVKPGLCGYRYLSVFLDTFFFRMDWTLSNQIWDGCNNTQETTRRDHSKVWSSNVHGLIKRACIHFSGNTEAN